jgi:hypothetical protein
MGGSADQGTENANLPEVMLETSHTELPPAPTIDTAHRLPPAEGPRPLRAGARGLASVLERVGQDDKAEYLRDLNIDHVDAKVGAGISQVEERVRRRPLTTIAIALVAGFFAGRILRD